MIGWIDEYHGRNSIELLKLRKVDETEAIKRCPKPLQYQAIPRLKAFLMAKSLSQRDSVTQKSKSHLLSPWGLNITCINIYIYTIYNL